MNYTAYSTSDAHYLCEKREKWNNAITIMGELVGTQLKNMGMNLYHSCFMKI